MNNTPALSLYDLLVTRDFDPQILDASGKEVSNPSEAEMFSFDYKTDEKNYGTVVILFGTENELEVYFGDNVGRSMEGDDKSEWYTFLAQLKQFATRNMLTFNLNNIGRLKHTMQGMAAIKEGLFEGYYGKKNVSYSDQPKQVRLKINHSRNLGEGEARYRAIESVFVETADGECFKVPSRSLAHGKMLARHVSEGGNPYDAFGQHINELVSEMSTLSRFIRAAQRKGFDGEAGAVVEAAVRHYSDLKDKAKQIISNRGYREARENFDPAEITEGESTMEAIRNMFIEQSLDQRIEEALPILAKLKDKNMREIDEFENWINDNGNDYVEEQQVNENHSPVAGAITRRILMQRPDLLQKYGPVAVTQAIDDVADFVGDTEEIGSSDVSGWIKQVEQSLSGIAEGTSQGIMLNGKEVDMRSLEIENVDSRDYPDFSDAYIGRASFTDGTDLSDQELDQLNDEHGDLVHELAYDSLHESDLGEDLDTDGVMMTKQSNMSSESVDPLIRLRELTQT